MRLYSGSVIFLIAIQPDSRGINNFGDEVGMVGAATRLPSVGGCRQPRMIYTRLKKSPGQTGEMKVVLTSCMNAERVPVQPIWKRIQEVSPDALFLLGDQIYMDWGLWFGIPQWKRWIAQAPVTGLRAFREEMHGRYAAQASVESFRDLAVDLSNRGVPILMTWDDHDFAWNYGNGDRRSKSGVTTDVAEVSRALFRQFVDHMTGNPGAEYPPVPTEAHMKLLNRDDRFPEQAGRIGNVDYLMLDLRRYRTDPGLSDRVLLGAEQRKRFRQAIGADNSAAEAAGLLLVGGGSAITHDHFVIHQDWENNGQPYPEFHDLDDAKRPVLYMGGDIHRGQWGGLIGDTNVVQILASGAAIPPIIGNMNRPCYASIEIQTDEDRGGWIAPVFEELQDDGVWQTIRVADADDPFDEKPSFTATGWNKASVPAGESSIASEFAESARRQTRALLIFSLRQRVWRTKREDVIDAPLSKIDELFNGKLAASLWPEVMTMEPVVNDRLTIYSSDSLAETIDESVNRPIDESLFGNNLIRQFDAAIHAGKRSVVFFVHGFNKSFGDSIDQAIQLQVRYPDCLPILFSWPSGEKKGNGGLMAGSAEGAIAGANLAVASGGPDNDVGPGYRICALWSVLECFDRVASRYAGQINAVVLARSLGSKLFASAASEFGTPFRSGNGVGRVFLSSAAVFPEDYSNWTDKLQTELVFTINRHDRTLNVAYWGNGGDCWPDFLDDNRQNKQSGAVRLLDATEVPGTAQQHDYLFIHIHKDLTGLTSDLLYGEPLTSSIQRHNFISVSGSNGHYIKYDR